MIVLYHGSDYLFNKFLFKNVGKKSGTSGAGFGIYLTTSKVDALAYGKYVYTVNAELQKGLSNEKKTLSLPMYTRILQTFEELSENSYVESWGEFATVSYAAKQAYTNCRSDVDLINEIINATGSPLDMMTVLKKYGYTHAIDNGTPEDETTTNYVFYDLSALKIIKREKITDDLTESIIELYENIVDSLCESGLESRVFPPMNPVSSPLVTLGEIPTQSPGFKGRKITEKTIQNNAGGDILNQPNFAPAENKNLSGRKLNQSVYDESDLYTPLRELSNNAARENREYTLTQAQGRAKSKSQRRLMAMALAYKRGKLPAKYASDTIKKLSKSIEQDTLHDFAKTNQKKRRKDGSISKRNNIPYKVNK